MLFLSFLARPYTREAGYFLTDLLSMYLHYIRDRGWEAVFLFDKEYPGDPSSCLEAILWIDADAAVEELRFEIGLHRGIYSDSSLQWMYGCAVEISGARASGSQLTLLDAVGPAIDEIENTNPSKKQYIIQSTIPLGSVEQLRESIYLRRNGGVISKSQPVVRTFNYPKDRVTDLRLDKAMALHPIVFQSGLEDLIIRLECFRAGRS